MCTHTQIHFNFQYLEKQQSSTFNMSINVNNLKCKITMDPQETGTKHNILIFKTFNLQFFSKFKNDIVCKNVS